jgi:hypothetical protein
MNSLPAAAAPTAQPSGSSRRRARGSTATVFPTRAAIGTPAEEAEGRSLLRNTLVTHTLCKLSLRASTIVKTPTALHSTGPKTLLKNVSNATKPCCAVLCCVQLSKH